MVGNQKMKTRKDDPRTEKQKRLDDEFIKNWNKGVRHEAMKRAWEKLRMMKLQRAPFKTGGHNTYPDIRRFL